MEKNEIDELEKLQKILDNMADEGEGGLRNLAKKIKVAADKEKRIGDLEDAILSGFGKSDNSFSEIIKALRIISSQLSSPLTASLEQLYPDTVKVSNLKELDIPDQIDVKKPGWYKELDLKPIIDVIQKQYNLSLEDIVTGNKGTVTSSISTCIRGQEGYKIYITDVTVTNHSPNSSYCEISGGNTKWTIPAPINNGVGGATLHFSTPLPGDAGKDWSFRVSPATNIVYCSMVGFRKAA